MQPILTSDQMKEWDAGTIRDLGVPSLVLMERAALAIADTAAEIASDSARKPARILAVCGPGNNGGDGAAAARILTLRGFSCRILMAASYDRLSPDMEAQIGMCDKLGIPITKAPETDMASVRDFDVIIDAVFGIGLKRTVEDPFGLFEAINASGVPVVSADIPSGISADTGEVMGCAVKADVTVTMQALKIGHLLYPGTRFCGRTEVADIGIRPLDERVTHFSIAREDLSLIPPRDPRGNKGTFGKVLVIAGSRNMSGASFLTCLAALHSGCGMVRLLTPECNRVIIQETLPEVMLNTYEEEESALDELRKASAWADVIACGPGLGTDRTAHRLVEALLKENKKSLILDADALNCLDGSTSLFKEAACPVLITPHPGEMARLTGLAVKEITGDLIGSARSLCKETGAVCVLKDARTCTARPDDSVFINTTGNSGMATAGSGDVLTGIAAGLAARGMPLTETGPMAVYLHGMCGDIAAAKYGPSAVTARTLIEALPDALNER